MTRFAYIGTYTRPAPYLAATNGKGLYTATYDESSGKLEIVQEVSGIENPSYLCVSPDGRTVHAVWEVVDWDHGLVSTYLRDPVSGELTFRGVQSSQGVLACYVAMVPDASCALVANYLSGTVALFPVRPDGSLAEATSVIQQEGSGPDPERQEGPHAHCIVPHQDGRHAVVADLGADRLIVYRIDAEAGRLVPHSDLAVTRGSGPRHVVFHPDGRHAYAIHELGSMVSALRFDPDEGIVEAVGSYPTLPAGFEGHSHCADIRVHPSGRFVYGSNRGHDSITMFSVDDDTGGLELIGHRSTEGATPRNFILDPAGRFLLVANQDSDTIVSFPVDQDSGHLGEPAAVTDCPTPVCLVFAP